MLTHTHIYHHNLYVAKEYIEQSFWEDKCSLSLLIVYMLLI